MMEGIVSKEAEMSIAASSMFPGFRFSPTDEELISFYLHNKVHGSQHNVSVISQIEIWKFEPWDLPAKSIIRSDHEWFFFSPRGRKYPNGSQSRRATELGYWKATGKERNVKSGSNVIGTKRTLVFHIGRAPKAERTEWIMHEYCLKDKPQDCLVVCRLRKNTEFRTNETTNRAASAAMRDCKDQDHDEPVGCSSRKYSSSFSSHSIDQIEAASECNPNETPEVTNAVSSVQLRDGEDEEDFYAEILNDDIINLDASSLSSTPDLPQLIANTSEAAEKQSQQSFSKIPPQGTANRRIRLRKQGHLSLYQITCAKEVEVPKSDKSLSITMAQHCLQVVFVTLIVLALILASFQGAWKGRRTSYSSLFQGFWH